MELVKISRILDSYFPYDVSNIILNLLLTECKPFQEEIKITSSYYFEDYGLSEKSMEYLIWCDYDDFCFFFENLTQYYNSIFNRISLDFIIDEEFIIDLLKTKNFHLSINKIQYLVRSFKPNNFINFFYDYINEDMEESILSRTFSCLGRCCKFENIDIPILYLYHLSQQK